jgi:hypothetical protein
VLQRRLCRRALKASLSQRKCASDAIGDVRSHVLFVDVEMVRPADGAPEVDLAKRVIDVLRDKGSRPVSVV